MADIVLLNPRFEVSYWGMEHALPFMGKKANQPVACLPLLAALTPPGHSVTLLDENVEPIDFARLARADIVGLTGMSVQRFRMRQILSELKKRGCFIVVGGPWVTVQENYFDDLVDVIFVGEAEETWPRFLHDWALGQHQARYEQAERTDMTKVPTPRFDLLKMKHYLFGTVQFSRGCPFQCEFCDIIVTFGRRPRLKTGPQVMAELEALRRENVNIAFIVDDNLIGNKKAIKGLLRELIAYQHANRFPFDFFTEASIDLADDDELMNLMVEANIVSVFVGIETPNEKALQETKKFQNVRATGTLVEKIHRIQNAGMEVMCGMIVGFDSDDAGIFEVQEKFLKEARIINAMVGMLAAIPKTPLHSRLRAEGRLDPNDQPEFGTNVIPLQMSRQQLRDGFLRVMQNLVQPKAYFDRVEDLFITGKFRVGRDGAEFWGKHRWTYWKLYGKRLFYVVGLYCRLGLGIPEQELRREYRRRLIRFMRLHRNPGMILLFLLKCALHYHLYTMTRQMALNSTALVNTF